MLRECFQSSPNPTWSELVEALRSPDINRPDIAAEVEDYYIKIDDSSVQESKDTAGEWLLHWHSYMPRLRMHSEVYGSVFVCRLLQLLNDWFDDTTCNRNTVGATAESE